MVLVMFCTEVQYVAIQKVRLWAMVSSTEALRVCWPSCYALAVLSATLLLCHLLFLCCLLRSPTTVVLSAVLPSFRRAKNFCLAFVFHVSFWLTPKISILDWVFFTTG